MCVHHTICSIFCSWIQIFQFSYSLFLLSGRHRLPHFCLRDFSFWLGTSYRLKFTNIRRENSGAALIFLDLLSWISRFDLRDFSFWLGTSYRLKFTIIRSIYFWLSLDFWFLDLEFLELQIYFWTLGQGWVHFYISTSDFLEIEIYYIKKHLFLELYFIWI